ncbi:MAG: hypothetical protein JWO68_1, partial [Actinomycetia bacterium]|nr:hypothetical protein [Actinomycetes bacterium]
MVLIADVQLLAPDGSPVAVTLLDRDGRTARFETDAETWERLHQAGLFNTGATPTSRAFETDRPVEIEAALDPNVDPDDGEAAGQTESWWALSATQAVDLPADLVEEGTLRDGVRFRPPPWAAGIEGAWRAMSD